MKITLRGKNEIKNPSQKNIEDEIDNLITHSIKDFSIISEGNEWSKATIRNKNSLFEIDISNDSGEFRSKKRFNRSELNENILSFLENKKVERKNFKTIPENIWYFIPIAIGALILAACWDLSEPNDTISMSFITLIALSIFIPAYYIRIFIDDKFQDNKILKTCLDILLIILIFIIFFLIVIIKA